MAGRLTWQNVAAPDFSSSAVSQRNAADLLDRAFNSGISAIDNFQNAPIEREGLMLRNELVGQQIATAKNEQAAREKINLAAPILNQMATLAASGNRDGFLKVASENQEVINSLDPKFVADMFANKQVMVASDDNITNAREDRKLAATERGNAEALLNLRANDLIQYGNDPAAATVGIMQNLSKIPEHLRGRYIAQASQQFKGLFGSDLDLSGYGGGVSQAQAEPSANSNGGKFNYVPAEGLSGSQWAKSAGLYTSESGGDYQAKNDAVGSGGKKGHFGALQFGEDRLTDAKRAGVIPADMTPEQFRQSGAEVQDAVADWHFADIDNQAARMGLDQAYGTVIKGVVITPESVRGMAHLGGIGGVRDFIRTNGEKDPADANGTRLSTYGKRFGKSPESNQQLAQQPAAIPLMAARNPDTGPLRVLNGAASIRDQLLARASQAANQGTQATLGNVSKQPTQQGFNNTSDLLAAVNMPGYEAAAQADITERVSQFSDPLLNGAEEWMTDTKYSLNQAGKDLSEEFKSFGKTDDYWQKVVRRLQSKFENDRGRTIPFRAITEVLKNSKSDMSAMRQWVNDPGVLDRIVSEGLDQLGSNDFAEVTSKRKAVLALDEKRKKLTADVLAAQEKYELARQQALAIPSRANQARAAEDALQRSLDKLMRVTNEIYSIPVGNGNKQTAKEKAEQFAKSIQSALGIR